MVLAIQEVITKHEESFSSHQYSYAVMTLFFLSFPQQLVPGSVFSQEAWCAHLFPHLPPLRKGRSLGRKVVEKMINWANESFSFFN